jgi:hypothetical protein
MGWRDQSIVLDEPLALADTQSALTQWSQSQPKPPETAITASGAMTLPPFATMQGDQLAKNKTWRDMSRPFSPEQEQAEQVNDAFHAEAIPRAKSFGNRILGRTKQEVDDFANAVAKRLGKQGTPEFAASPIVYHSLKIYDIAKGIQENGIDKWGVQAIRKEDRGPVLEALAKLNEAQHPNAKVSWAGRAGIMAGQELGDIPNALHTLLDKGSDQEYADALETIRRSTDPLVLPEQTYEKGGVLGFVSGNALSLVGMMPKIALAGVLGPAGSGAVFGIPAAAQEVKSSRAAGAGRAESLTAGVLAGAFDTLLFSKVPGRVFGGLGGKEAVSKTLSEAAHRYAFDTLKTGATLDASALKQQLLQSWALTASGKDPNENKVFGDFLASQPDIVFQSLLLQLPHSMSDAMRSRRSAEAVGLQGTSKPARDTVAERAEKAIAALEQQLQTQAQGENRAVENVPPSEVHGDAGPQPGQGEVGGGAPEGGQGVQQGGRPDGHPEGQAAPEEKVVVPPLDVDLSDEPPKAAEPQPAMPAPKTPPPAPVPEPTEEPGKPLPPNVPPPAAPAPSPAAPAPEKPAVPAADEAAKSKVAGAFGFGFGTETFDEIGQQLKGVESPSPVAPKEDADQIEMFQREEQGDMFRKVAKPEEAKSAAEKKWSEAKGSLGKAGEAFRDIGRPGGGSPSSIIGITAKQVNDLTRAVGHLLKAGVKTVEAAIEWMRENVKGWDEKFVPAFKELWEQQKPPEPPKEAGGLPEGPDITAARNAITQAITGEARPEVNKEGHRQEELLDAADPRRARDVLDRIAADPNAPISDQDVNDLNVRMKLRRDAYAAAVERGDKSLAAAAQDDVREIARALQVTGTAQGRALASRQANIEADWSFGHMLQQAEEDSDEPISADEQQKIMDRARRMQALNKEIDNAEGQEIRKRRDQTVQKVIDDAASGKLPDDVPQKVEARFRKFMEVVDAWWNSKVDAARARMRDYFSGTKHAALPVADMAIIGADYIKKGATTLATWTAKMVDEFGEAIRPGAPEIWDAIDQELDKQDADLKAHLVGKTAPGLPADRLKDIIKDAGKTAKTADETKAEILKKMKARLGNKSALNFQVWKLMYEFASEGIDNIPDMHKAVHAELVKLDPDWTERQTMEAMGGYGDFKRPSEDEARKTVADLHRQAQGLSKLATIEIEGIAPLRSGKGREAPSDDARKIERKVQNEMRKRGIESTDPATQQRSMLDARKRQRSNAISDLQDAINSNSRIERGKTSIPTDEELKVLDEKYGLTRADYEQHFAAELEVDRLEKSINYVTDQVKRAKGGEDIWKGKAKTPEAKSAKIDALQANLEALKAEREALKRTNAAVLARRAEARLEAITARANELREQLETKKFPESKKADQPTNPEIEAALKEVQELQKRVKASKAAMEEADRQVWEGEGGAPKQRATVSEARKMLIAIKGKEASLLRQIADYKSRMADGEFGPKPVKKPLVWPKEIMDRVRQRDAVVAEWEQQRRKWQFENRNWKERLLDGVRKFAQTTVLTGSGSLWKISAASLLRFVKLPINELVATGWRSTPGVGKLFKEAPVYGGGSLNSVLHGWSQGLTQGFIDAYQSVTKGQTPFSKYPLDPGLYSRIMRIPGSIHEALKSPGARAVFEHALHHSMRFEVEHGNEATDPDVIERSKTRAMEAMWRAKLVETNKVVDSYERLFQHIDKKTGKQTPGAKVAETAATAVMPIKRVPTNFAGQVLEHFTGLISGGVGVRKFLREGIDSMTPEERDTVARRLTNGTLGAVGAVMAIGFFAPGVIGGHWKQGEKKKPGETPFGGIDGIPPQILHDPLLDVLQTGQDVRKTWDEKTAKGAGTPEKLTTSIGAGVLGVLDEVPFYRLADTVAQLRSDQGWQRLGEQQVPLAFKEIYGKLNDASAAVGATKKKRSKK